jgi:hypothetical protein
MNRESDKYYLVRKNGEFSVIKGTEDAKGSRPSFDGMRTDGDPLAAVRADVIVAVEVPPGTEAVFTVMKNRNGRHGVIQSDPQSEVD